MAIKGSNHFGVADMYVDLFAFFQNVGIPIHIQAGNSGGNMEIVGDVGDLVNHNLSPSKPVKFECDNVDSISISIGTTTPQDFDENEIDLFQYFHHLPHYIGLLGHNFNSMNCKVDTIHYAMGQSYPNFVESEFGVELDTLGSDIGQYNGITSVNTINSNDIGTTFVPEKDGFSLFPTLPYLRRNNSSILIRPTGEKINGTVELGGLFSGCLFQLGHADLRMNYNLDTSGVDTMETIGGHRFTNARWTQRPLWQGKYVPFEKQDYVSSASSSTHLKEQTDPRFRRMGKKSWSVQMSYLSNEEAFGATDSTNVDSIHNGYDIFNNSISHTMPDILGRHLLKTKSGNMFSGFNMTLGHLPFIFNPNSNMKSSFNYYNKYPAQANPVPQFIKAYFDQDSFSYTQVAPDLWNTKFNIKESF